MKKTALFILSLSMFLCPIACKTSSNTLTKYSDYKVKSYTVSLPDSYAYKNLSDVKAEPTCIAMLSDVNGKLPDLWIYEEESSFASIKEFVADFDKIWNFKEMCFYEKDGVFLARTLFEENWYGQSLFNEAYFRKGINGKVFLVDFVYDKSADSKLMHSCIVEMAEKLGF